MFYALTKKAVMVGVLGGGTMLALFGAPAASYVGTAFFKVRTAAKNAVPVQFEIDRAKHEIDKLNPAIHQHIEILARAEEDVKRLDTEIRDTTANLERQKSQLLALRAKVEKSDGQKITFTSDDHKQKITFTSDDRNVEGLLRSRLESYNRSERVLKEKQATLASRQKVVDSAREHLVAIATQKKALEAKIEEIQARLAAIEASNARNQYHFDGSALANAKKTVSELDERLNVVSRIAEMEGRLTEDGTLAPAVKSIDDVTDEIDSKFGLDDADSDNKPESTKL